MPTTARRTRHDAGARAGLPDVATLTDDGRTDVETLLREAAAGLERLRAAAREVWTTQRADPRMLVRREHLSQRAAPPPPLEPTHA